MAQVKKIGTHTSSLTLEEGIPEIKERAIKNIHTKFRTNLVDAALVASEMVQLPGVILTWVNKYQS